MCEVNEQLSSTMDYDRIVRPNKIDMMCEIRQIFQLGMLELDRKIWREYTIRVGVSQIMRNLVIGDAIG